MWVVVCHFVANGAPCLKRFLHFLHVSYRSSIHTSALPLPSRSGRLVDHLENTKGFNLRSVKYLILDEADRMLSMDFEEEINQILEVIPRSRTTFLFSATMTTKVAKLQRAAMRDPVKVQVNSKYQTVKTLIQRCVLESFHCRSRLYLASHVWVCHQARSCLASLSFLVTRYLFIPEKYKDCYLVYILNEFAGQTALIFTKTCNECERLTHLLRNLGFEVCAITLWIPRLLFFYSCPAYVFCSAMHTRCLLTVSSFSLSQRPSACMAR